MTLNRIGWIGLFCLCLSLEAVALYYQYWLDQLPCVLCIHVRMLLFVLLIISLLGIVFSSFPGVTKVLIFCSLSIWLWMTERSFQLLGTERGWLMGECQMHSGLPDWLALEEWLPGLFKIYEPCGYTPVLMFEITMAEALMVLSPLMVLISIIVLVQAYARPKLLC